MLEGKGSQQRFKCCGGGEEEGDVARIVKESNGCMKDLNSTRGALYCMHASVLVHILEPQDNLLEIQPENAFFV